MLRKDLRIREGDTTEISCQIPQGFIGGTVTFLLLLQEGTGILKEATAAEEVTFILEEADTVTRVGRLEYEIRVKKDAEALVGR